MTSYQESHSYTDPSDLEDIEESQRSSRSLRGVLQAMAVVVVIVLVLLLLRSCGDAGDDSRGTQGGKSIQPVAGSAPVDGMISLWVDEGADVGSIIADAGVPSTGRIDMGDGQWIVTLTTGSEKSSVKALDGSAGVVDAGLVYGKDDTAGLTP